MVDHTSYQQGRYEQMKIERPWADRHAALWSRLPSVPFFDTLAKTVCAANTNALPNKHC
jgi:hypothetical protein